MIRSKITILFFFSSLGLNLTAIIYAIYRGINRGDYARYYKEGYFLTNVSTLHLLIISFLCFYLYSLKRKYIKENSDKNKGKPIFWIILCLGFLFLGIDEQFMVHESIDIYTHNLMESLFNYHGNSITKRLDDIIVLLYFIFGVSMINKYKEEIILFNKAKYFLRLALILTLMMISLDISSSQNDFFSLIFPIEDVKYLIKIIGVIEDSIKLFALTFFGVWIGSCIAIVKKKVFNIPKTILSKSKFNY